MAAVSVGLMAFSLVAGAVSANQQKQAAKRAPDYAYVPPSAGEAAAGRLNKLMMQEQLRLHTGAPENILPTYAALTKSYIGEDAMGAQGQAPAGQAPAEGVGERALASGTDVAAKAYNAEAGWRQHAGAISGKLQTMRDNQAWASEWANRALSQELNARARNEEARQAALGAYQGIGQQLGSFMGTGADWFLGEHRAKKDEAPSVESPYPGPTINPETVEWQPPKRGRWVFTPGGVRWEYF